MFVNSFNTVFPYYKHNLFNLWRLRQSRKDKTSIYRLQFFSVKKHYRLAFLLIFFAIAAAAINGVSAQVVVDKTVATVSDGARTELITYSDLLWQLALQPGVPLNPPRPEDLRRALLLQIDQRIFALEAERLPRTAPTDKEIKDKIADLLSRFASTADFERRLRLVGFSSVKDDNFENLISQRVAIEKYVDFRFRSFVVITQEDLRKYYIETYLPDFRRRYPGRIIPRFEEVAAEIQSNLTEERVARDIEDFLDGAKRRLTVTMLIEP